MSPAERGDMVTAYYARLTSPDMAVRRAAAKAWSVWEAATSFLFPDPMHTARAGEDRFADAMARIECHYFVNKGFFDSDNHLLTRIDQIRHIPAVIVQGRYDVVCPMVSAWELHTAWPEADLNIVPDAGHSSMEAGIVDRLVTATDRFR